MSALEIALAIYVVAATLFSLVFFVLPWLIGWFREEPTPRPKPPPKSFLRP